MSGAAPPWAVIRLDFPGGRIGHGKVALLEAVAADGSVAAAALALVMSYPRTLALLGLAQRRLGNPDPARRLTRRGGQFRHGRRPPAA
jgi:molybdenum-dependent DNA-binding transcriptional regulator ModE